MKKIIIFISLLFLYSCVGVDCKKSAEYQRGIDVNFVIINKKPLNHGRQINLKIKNIKNNQIENYSEENTWFAWHYEDFQNGDTIVMNKGEIVFAIHKKDTILKINFECDGQIFR